MELAQTYEKVNPDDTRWPYIFYYLFVTGTQSSVSLPENIPQ